MQLMSGRNAAGGGLRERKKRATRAALAEAAVRLAAEHGVEKVTVEAISAAAGVSVRTFFNYFDTRDDAFVAVDSDAHVRIRRSVLDAPAALSPLDAVREAIRTELAEAEQRHELWRLHAEVLRAAPHLLVRRISAHMADETELAEAVAERIRARSGAPARRSASAAASAASATEEERRAALDLYPRLLAAVATTAVRVSLEHWCARQDELSFPDVFQEAFSLLAAGLPAPPVR
ncbi:TetR family transcriptional regulator [Streptomyces leeuwenhoekii]|uniref:TetR Family Transcriptional Regulator n=1 Tax=Streptomyces leeuwenhoekii TaxID=1437453 RepID=A0A0F7W857_STRLW|nr:TetR family transcriptional regulator [Streptomyces leeuwenhoekii]CQR66082.1 TetR Family Transcriptional Regulator [Streptomyces leeuwenhoekii]